MISIIVYKLNPSNCQHHIEFNAVYNDLLKILRYTLTTTNIPVWTVAVPGIFLVDKLASSAAARLGCPISSLPINRHRQLSTPAHTYALLYLPPAAQSISGRCHSLGSLHPPPAALPSLPTSFATLSRQSDEMMIDSSLMQVHQGTKKSRYPFGYLLFLAPLAGLEPAVIARAIQLKIIGCYYGRLRCPIKSSGLRFPSIL